MNLKIISIMTRSINHNTFLQDDSDGDIEVVENKILNIVEFNVNKDGFWIRLITEAGYSVNEKDTGKDVVSVQAAFSIVYEISDYDFPYSDEAANAFLDKNPTIIKRLKSLNSIIVNMELRKILDELRINSRLPVFEEEII